MDFSLSPKVVDLQKRVMAFVQEHVIPGEQTFKEEMAAFRAAGNPWQHTRTMETLKEKAKAYIERARDSALETRLASENAALKARIDALEAQLLGSPVAPDFPAQPQSTAGEQDAVFVSWEDGALKTFIKERGGEVPRGNPSHATLVRKAEELFAAEQEAA